MMIQEVVIIVVHKLLSSMLLLMHLIMRWLVDKSISHGILINFSLMILRDIADQFLIGVIQLFKLVFIRVPRILTADCSSHSEVNKVWVIICLRYKVSCRAPKRILKSHVVTIEFSFHAIDCSD